jgi:hypothetical protein
MSALSPAAGLTVSVPGEEVFLTIILPLIARFL